MQAPDPGFVESPANAHARSPHQVRTWYAPVAQIYARVRPAHPQELIEWAIAQTHLSNTSRLLEIGCGPGNATLAFAPFGMSMTCLEPNPHFYHLAQHRCAAFDNVTFHNSFFEAWPAPPGSFQAVLAANAFHWLPPEIRCVKSAELLQEDGFLILLWNLMPEPSLEVYEAIESLYQAYAPSLARYEGAIVQAEILQGFGQAVLDSGHFKTVVTEQMTCQVTYGVEEFLQLLSTLRRLEPGTQSILFEKLRETLQPFGETVSLSFLSAVQIAQKL